MYFVKNGKKSSNTQKEPLVESFSVNWKDSKTWFLLTGIILAVVFVVLLIIFLAQCGKSHSSSSYKSASGGSLPGFKTASGARSGSARMPSGGYSSSYKSSSGRQSGSSASRGRSGSRASAF
jgi:hypothetical protein